MLKQEYVKIKIVGKNIKYFKEKGYLNINIKDEVNILSQDLMSSSRVKITAVCDLCTKENIISYCSYLENLKRGDGIYTCNHPCAKHKREKTIKNKYGNSSYFKTNDFKDKSIKTNLEKYGVDNYAKTEDSKTKIKETNLKKYGVDNYTKTEECKKKTKETNLKKYGVEFFPQSDVFKTKSEITFLKNYGVKNAFLNADFQKKIKDILFDKYGENHPMHFDYIKEKIKKTNIKKYGVEHCSQTDEFWIKYKKTCLIKYGFEHPMQNAEVNLKQFLESCKAKKYKNLYYRSSYELDFIKLCESMNIDIEQGGWLPYKYKGKNKVYFYDFIIPKLNLIIEIKSRYLYKKYFNINISKKRCCKSHGFEFMFIIDKKYKKFLSIINTPPNN